MNNDRGVETWRRSVGVGGKRFAGVSGNSQLELFEEAQRVDRNKSESVDAGGGKGGGGGEGGRDLP